MTYKQKTHIIICGFLLSHVTDMEVPSRKKLNKITNRIKTGKADIFDTLNGINFKLIDFPELYKPISSKHFWCFVSPLVSHETDSSKSNKWEIIKYTQDNINKTLANWITDGMKNINWGMYLIDDENRYISNQEIVRYYHIALKYLENYDELGQNSTPFDLTELPLIENKEFINSILVTNLILDNYCEIVEYLWDWIDTIDQSNIKQMFDKYVNIQKNMENLTEVEMLRKIRNAIRHNNYRIRMNGNIAIKTKKLQLEIPCPFFDDFNWTHIKNVENWCSSNIDQKYDFSLIDWQKWFIDNIENIKTPDWNSVILSERQLKIADEFFRTYKFAPLPLKLFLSQTELNDTYLKFLIRTSMIDWIGHIFGVENYDSSYIKTILNNTFNSDELPMIMRKQLQNYIKIQCIKYYYINSPDVKYPHDKRKNDRKRHLRNGFTHWRYTDSFFSKEIVVRDMDVHNIDTTTWNPKITYEWIFDIDVLYNNIEKSWWFSNMIDLEQDNPKGFVVWNLNEDENWNFESKIRYLFFDDKTKKYEQILWSWTIAPDTQTLT